MWPHYQEAWEGPHLPLRNCRSTQESTQNRCTHTPHPLHPHHCDPPATPSCFLSPLLWPSIHHFLSQGDHLYLGQPFLLSDYCSVCLRVWQSLARLASLRWHIFLSASLAGWQVLRGLHCILLIITSLCYAAPITWCMLVNVCRTDELINQSTHISPGPRMEGHRNGYRLSTIVYWCPRAQLNCLKQEGDGFGLLFVGL